MPMMDWRMYDLTCVQPHMSHIRARSMWRITRTRPRISRNWVTARWVQRWSSRPRTPFLFGTSGLTSLGSMRVPPVLPDAFLTEIRDRDSNLYWYLLLIFAYSNSLALLLMIFYFSFKYLIIHLYNFQLYNYKLVM